MAEMNDLPLFTLNTDGYIVHYLDHGNGQAAQQLMERCADYAQLVTGLPVGDADGISLYLNVPEGWTPDDKLLIGLFQRQPELLIGVIDAVRGYPTPRTWYIGLFLLQPDRRGQGLGKALYTVFSSWAARHGAETIQLGIVEQNPRARRFWERLGFQQIGTKRAAYSGTFVNIVHIMQQPLNLSG